MGWCDFVFPALIIAAVIVFILIGWKIEPPRLTNELDFVGKLFNRKGKGAFDDWDAQIKYRTKISLAFVIPILVAVALGLLANNFVCK